MSRTPQPEEIPGSLEDIAASLQATQQGLAECLEIAARRAWKPGPSALPHPAVRVLAEVGLVLEGSRERIAQALKTLPAAADYAPHSERLRAAMSLHAELAAVVAETPRLAVPLREAMQGLASVAEDLGSARERLDEAARILALDAPVAPVQAVNQTLASLRAMAEAHAERAFEHAAEAEGQRAPAVAESQAVAALHAEIDALSTSLRAVADLAAPLVDTLSDLSHGADRLRAEPAVPVVPPPAPARAAAAGQGDVGDWAADILRSLRELSKAVASGPASSPGQEQRLWESVRDLHLEVVNLKGALLSPTRRAPGGEPRG
jgi:hypothetical protein